MEKVLGLLPPLARWGMAVNSNPLEAENARLRREVAEWQARARESLLARLRIQNERDRLAEELRSLRPKHR